MHFSPRLLACLFLSCFATFAAAQSAPIANDDSVSTNEDFGTTWDVVANDTDADGDALTIISVGAASHGNAFFKATQPHNASYQPNHDYFGPDSFTYTISDGNGNTATATVNVTISPVNDPPSAVDDTADVDQDSGPTTIDVRGNDSDIDSPSLTIISVGAAANGSTSFDPFTVSYQPNAGYAGPDSFTYEVSDGQGGTAIAMVFITVRQVNHPPLAVDDSLSMGEDSTASVKVLTNDSDPDGDPLTIFSTTNGAHGTTTFSNTPPATCSYTPDPDYFGSDSFTYLITDGQGGKSSATVNVTILPANDAPAANPDFASTAVNNPVSITVVVNDADPDGDALNVISFDATTAAGGKVTSSGNVLTYSPKRNFSGNDTFNYSITDGNGGNASAQVTVNVAKPPANDNFNSAVTINTTTSITVTGGNVLATNETGEPDHAAGLGGGPSAGKSVWWTWKSPNGKGDSTIGNVTMSTADSAFNTVLAVYVKGGQPVRVNSVVLKANNDDANVSRQSEVSFAVLPGTTYYIAVDGSPFAFPSSGSIQLSVSFVPAGTG